MMKTRMRSPKSADLGVEELQKELWVLESRSGRQNVSNLVILGSEFGARLEGARRP